jgi:hypothetical protein
MELGSLGAGGGPLEAVILGQGGEAGHRQCADAAKGRGGDEDERADCPRPAEAQPVSHD